MYSSFWNLYLIPKDLFPLKVSEGFNDIMKQNFCVFCLKFSVYLLLQNFLISIEVFKCQKSIGFQGRIFMCVVFSNLVKRITMDIM